MTKEDGSQAGVLRWWPPGCWVTPDGTHTLPTVLGGPESRGVLRKMSDLLELMVKRMDMLARLENSSEPHRVTSDTHLAADR